MDDNQQLPTPQVDWATLPEPEREELKARIKNRYLVGRKLVQLEEEFGVRQHMIKYWVNRENWELAKEEFQKTALILTESSQGQLLDKSADNLSKLIFLHTDRGLKSFQADGHTAGLNLKAITDAIDKLSRLKLHVDSGGVSKTANIKVDLSESILQDVIMEVTMELERVAPQLNSRELVKRLFAEQLKKITGKIK